MTLVVEGFETAPDVNVFSFFWQRASVFGVLVAVDPLLYIDEAGSVVELERVVCGLGGYGVDLTDEG